MRTNTAVLFARTLIEELRQGRQINAQLRSALEHELVRRDQMYPYVVYDARGWDMLAAKLLRFRPRLIGAVAAYSVLSGLSRSEIEAAGGLGMFRMFWFLGSSQDDLIDEIDRSVIDSRRVKRQLLEAIFGRDRVFYQSAFAVFAKGIDQAGFSPAAKSYLRHKTKSWYRLLIEQEADVLHRNIYGLNFEYCRSYREEQNRAIGELLTACLNGARCVDPNFQRLEADVPILSFRTQVIDDIADLAEDLAMIRPSFCVGALVDHPDELASVWHYLAVRSAAIKMRPATFRRLAPQSFRLVESLYHSYGADLRTKGDSGVFLATVGDRLFNLFPVFRDVMFRINPKAANF